MIAKHLTTGSRCPQRIKELARIYSMEYSLYSQRVRMVAIAKKLPHEVVNINLRTKPDWFLEIQPKGLVPVLLHNDNVITESVDICDYLEKEIPFPTLTNPEYVEADAELRLKWSAVNRLFMGTLLSKRTIIERGGFHNILKGIHVLMEPFESALKDRGTTFFNGDTPGLLDYILWPDMERFCLLYLITNHTGYTGYCFPPLTEDLTLFRKWGLAMFDTDAVMKTRHTIDTHFRFVETYKSGAFDYDGVAIPRSVL